jgi:hypothetical protein
MPPVPLDEMKRRHHIHLNLLCKTDVTNLLDANIALFWEELY